MRSAIGESAGVSDATEASTRRATSSGWSTVSHSEIRPPPDSASIAKGGSGPPLAASQSIAAATASAMTRGCMQVLDLRPGRPASGRPMTTTGRAAARPSHRRRSTCSVPASGRRPVSTPPRTSSGMPVAPPGRQPERLDPAAADRDRRSCQAASAMGRIVAC